MNCIVRMAVATALLAVATTSGCKKEDPAATYRIAGTEHFNKSKFNDAAESFRKSLEVDPKQEKLWDKLAFSYMRVGKEKEAAEALLKTLDFKTDPLARAEVYRNIGSMYVQGPNPKESEKYFVEAVKLNPKDDQSLLWLGEIASTRGGARDSRAPAAPADLEQAIGWYDQAIAAKPDELLPHVNKRIALLKLAKYEQTQKETWQTVAANARRDKAKKAEAEQKALETQARIDALKAQSDVVSVRIDELIKQGKKLTR